MEGEMRRDPYLGTKKEGGPVRSALHFAQAAGADDQNLVDSVNCTLRRSAK